MTRSADLLLTALAPASWGSTYLVTTEALPPDRPLTLAFLRALPAGLLLLALSRRLPSALWVSRLLILGGLNFAVFWSLLFVSAYRLPGGVAATVGALQPLLVVFFARAALGTKVRTSAIAGAILGAAGVALLLLTPEAALDPLGLAAGLGASASMAAGTVLSRKWHPPVPLLSFTAWQLTAGGLLLLPLAWALEPPLPELSAKNVAGLAYLSLIGAALTYLLWLRAVPRLEPAALSTLGLLSPVSAVLLGWTLLGERLSALQLLGAAVVLPSIALTARPRRRGVSSQPRSTAERTSAFVELPREGRSA